MSQHLTVLAIDDDPGDADLLQRHLQRIPDFTIEFVHCADPVRGRSELSRREVDLTIIDYQMGATTGLELIERIRADGDLRPIIVLTGHGDEYVAARTTRAGADDYLVKTDLNPALLARAISSAVAQYNQRLHAGPASPAAFAPARDANPANDPQRCDPLTRVLHRTALLEVVTHECSRARRHRHGCALLLIDLDHFGPYNDALGRLTGDLCLQHVAGCLLRALRPTDVVGRYGGDQFLAVLTEADAEAANALAARICAAVQHLALPHPVNPGGVVTVSVGAASLRPTDDWESLLQRAEEALFSARSIGRNRVCPCRPAGGAARRRELTVLAIDDDAGDAELLRRHLAEIPTLQCRLHHAVDHSQATDFLSRQPADLIFLDHRLGQADGLEILRALRGTGESAPIIAFTGQRSAYVAAELIAAGADDYLGKEDASPDTLRRAIETAIARRQQHACEEENRALLRELRDKNTELQTKNARLAEMCVTAHEFVDNVSHEFRTPLTVVKEFAAILLEGLAGELNPEQKDYLGIVLHRADDLAAMIDDMLDISRLEAGVLAVSRRVVTAADILDRVRNTLERKSSAGNVPLEIDLPADLPTLYCDPEKIGRVLINLTVNAVKFSSPGCCVRIWARSDDRGVVRFGVTDHGAGIHPDQLAEMFDRFKQLEGGIRASARGFGLGLNIAKELVQLNFGEITVDSAIGNGSTFSFTVPTSEPGPLLNRFLDHVSQLRGDLPCVSLIRMRATACPAPTVAAELERFIQHHIRRCDLLFALGNCEWLLLTASNSGEAGGQLDRISGAIAEANRNRPGDPLPPLACEPCGSWSIGADRAALAEHFAALLAEGALPHA